MHKKTQIVTPASEGLRYQVDHDGLKQTDVMRKSSLVGTRRNVKAYHLTLADRLHLSFCLIQPYRVYWQVVNIAPL